MKKEDLKLHSKRKDRSSLKNSEDERIDQENNLHMEKEDETDRVEDISTEQEISNEQENFTELLNTIAQLKEEVETYQTQIKDRNDQLLLARADLENFRRRTRKEKEEGLKYAIVPLLESLLPVLDNFERALKAVDGNTDSSDLKQGVEMVYRQFSTVLSQAGLTLIKAEGELFDPYQHNAVMRVDSEEHESGRVVEELQAGYRYHERIIRPSMVKVSN